MSKLFIFSAPSGAGKTTIVKELLKRDLNLKFSISACSRPKRKNEIHGKDYYFLSVDDFKKRIEENEFLEWEEVYKDQFYGTLKSEVSRLLDEGYNVVFDVDVIGGINIKKQYGDKAMSIFVMPPSIEELEKRLIARSTESETSLAKRIGKAKAEIEYSSQFDEVVINNNLKEAVEETYKKILDFFNS